MTTLSASASSSATSDVEISRCTPSSPPATADVSSPKPPRMTEMNERFIALHMM